MYVAWVPQGEEFAAITPKRLQIPPVSGGAVVKSKIIRDMDKKPNPDVRRMNEERQRVLQVLGVITTS